MLIPSNAEKIKTISEIFREEINDHVNAGGAYYDDRAGQIAAQAIHTIMPDLVDMQGSRVVVESLSGIGSASNQDKDYSSFTGLRVEAELKRVSIQQAVHNLMIGDTGLSYVSYDLFAVLSPRFEEPDPVDIVFSQELYVPFGSVEQFDPFN
jgi:hypothetical protein